MWQLMQKGPLLPLPLPLPLPPVWLVGGGGDLATGCASRGFSVGGADVLFRPPFPLPYPLLVGLGWRSLDLSLYLSFAWWPPFFPLLFGS